MIRKSAADTDCHHRVVLLRRAEVSLPSADGDLGLTVVDDVAIFPVREAGIELLVEISHGYECFVSPAKAEPIVARLPVGDRLPHRHVGEPHHVHDGAPPVLAGPAVTTGVLKCTASSFVCSRSYRVSQKKGGFVHQIKKF